MMQSHDFIRQALSRWYARNTVQAPDQVARREFGAGIDKKIDFRHLQFRDESALNAYIRTSQPVYISYSAGYYEFPAGRPMASKNWLGADLIFDLDADEYETPCTHPDDMICEICMERVRQEAIRVVEEFLVPDFGFSKGEIHMYFSGNRGYHMHIREEKVQSLSQNGRKELIDYLTGAGLMPEAVGLRMEHNLRGPTPSQRGWGGKVARSVKSLVESSDEREIAKKLGIQLKAAKGITDNREFFLNGIASGNWDTVKISKAAWEKALRSIALGLSVGVDKSVTMDVSRLIRLPGSIHGGTGFVAKEVRNIESFDVFKDPVVLGSDPVTVKCLADAQFDLKGEAFQTRENAEFQLPEFAAVYACGKGLARVVS